MRNSELLGVVVAGMVLAGVFSTRAMLTQGMPDADARHAVSSEPSSNEAKSRDGNPVARRASFPGASFGGTAAAPNITSDDQTVTFGEVQLTFSVAPRPAVALHPVRVRVRARSRGAPVTIENGRLTFTMDMPMGEHRYVLVRAADGWYEAEAQLPLCFSGDSRWRATVAGTVDGRFIAGGVDLVLAHPASGFAP
jgi:hypothetical protein